MIDIDLSDPDIVTLRPEGALGKADFDKLAATIDSRINVSDRIPNLVIRVDRLPYWDSLGALSRHFHFVREHGKIVQKVAIVGDSPLLAVAPEVANHFVAATIRRFPENKLEEAKAWARAVEDDPGRFELIEGLPRDVVAIRAVGIITAQDYEDMLVPLVKERLKEHDKIKCLIVLGDDFASYAGDAAWSDMKFGLAHTLDFRRVAVVTDIGWIRRTMKLFGPIMPFGFSVFRLAQLEEAKSWIKR